MNVTCPVSLGELVDKITILEIKAERISDPSKLHNVKAELEALNRTLLETLPSSDINTLAHFQAELRQINVNLWVIEDDIRNCERKKDFGQTFIELARAVYFTNDIRAEVKKKINIKFGSSLVEEKSYNPYA